MATLQKFKFLATQCAVLGSPTRSPTTSPVIHLRRRKTLRMLLGRTPNPNHHRRDPPSDAAETEADENDGIEHHRRRQQQHHRHQICVRHKLKDLFVSSPPPISEKMMDLDEAQQPAQESVRVAGAKIGSGAMMRPLSATLRQRLLRRAWRPVLVAIPEQSP